MDMPVVTTIGFNTRRTRASGRKQHRIARNADHRTNDPT